MCKNMWKTFTGLTGHDLCFQGDSKGSQVMLSHPHVMNVQWKWGWQSMCVGVQWPYVCTTVYYNLICALTIRCIRRTGCVCLIWVWLHSLLTLIRGSPSFFFFFPHSLLLYGCVQGAEQTEKKKTGRQGKKTNTWPYWNRITVGRRE